MPTTGDAAPLPELRASERLHLLDHVGCGIWVFDGEDTRYVNFALCEITGYSREELLQPQFFRSLVHPDYVDLLLERGRARVRGEDVPAQYEIAIVHRSGGTRWLSLNASRVLLSDGPISLVSAVDITRLKETEHTISVGVERLRALLNALPAHIITTTPQGKPTFVNEYWLEYTGLSLAEAMARGTASVIHPEDATRAGRAWNRAKRTGTGYDIEYRVRHHSGDYRWQLFRIRPFLENGQLLGWYCAAVDIHETKELHLNLQRANAELEIANRAKDEVLGLVSHELRTPITTLLGNSEMLARRWEDLEREDIRQVVTDIAVDARRLSSIIENMLVLSRSGLSDAADLEPVLVQRVVAPLIEDMRRRFPTRTLTFDCAPALPPILGNPTFVRLVVENLITNAAKYSPAGTPIDIAAGFDDGAIAITVADRGPGIDAEDLERVFEPFYRANATSRSAFGIGLGLTVCKRLTEIMGGTIAVRNREGGGAEFRVSLPAAAPESDTEVEPVLATA